MSRLGRFIAVAAIHILAIPLLLFYALTLTGSTTSHSPGLSNIFLVQLQTQNQTASESSSFVVRVGYFGICAGHITHLECTPSSGKSVDQLITTFFSSENSLLSGNATLVENNEVTKSLFRFALVLQSKIFLWLLAVSGMLLTMGLALNLVEVITVAKKKYGQSQKQQASRERLKRLSRTINWSSTALALAASVGIVQASSSLQFMSSSFSDSVNVTSGTTAQALHWLIVVFSFLITLGKTVVRPLKDSATLGTARAAPAGPGPIGGGIRPPAAGGPVVI